MPFWTRWLLAALATWRVAGLLVYTDGPGDILATLRSWLGDSVAGRIMDCFECTSVWVAAAFSFYVTFEPRHWPVVWLALAGGASLIERLHPAHREAVAQLDVESGYGAPENALLRPKSGTRGSTSGTPAERIQQP